MSVAIKMSTNTVGGQSTRQPPGSACLHCRNKKMKCDALQPRCKNCFNAGVECIRSNNYSRKRSAQRDHIEGPQDRVETSDAEVYDVQPKFNPGLFNLDFHMDSFYDMDYNFLENITPESFPILSPLDSLPSLIPSETVECSQPQTVIETAGILAPPLNDPINDLMHEDLDQLYLDRVHRLIPILHRRRYFSWTRSPNRTDAQTCLQFAMWTLATSLSTQLQHLRESFYQRTCSLLDKFTAQDTAAPQIEYAQACILIVNYDLMKENFRRGWTSAGRCIRVIQLMRLFEIDRSKGRNDREDWIQREEKRRAFWMAYSLDLFISLRGEWPLSLTGTDFVRLPALDKDFDNSHYVEMPFLGTVLSGASSSVLSPWAESIVFATIIRRITALTSELEGLSPGSSSTNVWSKIDLLRNILKSRLASLSFKHQDSHFPFSDDPMETFMIMIAQSSVLYLYNTQKSFSRATESSQNISMALQYEAQMAAQEIANLSTSILHMSRFKIHPFTPLILAKCMEFYKSNQNLDEITQAAVKQIYELLRHISKVNNIAVEYLS
ncbi:conserved hypothetical protein [Talaromyces stipitatus ATCC 10500]|uniref:Tropolone cluster transcription factor tropK n=1 Tax=Talaromyces stipitatus (strain ATCC 10500 / CBS 375.48 / QM 6759 / NRRL 1006) TaxID=441959 RepID=TROPK_TALSN|nr:uncharacterized protein TSTA_117810 [Talaromyces stipitatus ATCC 10500]B8M9K6.1 RecName: Full=Tropolone cluster transcription factor tropK; AltName: Full=Tropolone synthesis protein K [Talaromyces stipitatus ATCC 10500]EED18009.1 conserved hypothetical protein [Talaromyces stipitatus ATCC 10500]DAA64710.1 TPA_exp: TropK [Talaromyces stipitatus ATCC 10500]